MEELKWDERFVTNVGNLLGGAALLGWQGTDAYLGKPRTINNKSYKPRERDNGCPLVQALKQRRIDSGQVCSGLRGLLVWGAGVKSYPDTPTAVRARQLMESNSIVLKGRRDGVKMSGDAVKARTDDLVHPPKSRPFCIPPGDLPHHRIAGLGKCAKFEARSFPLADPSTRCDLHPT